MRGTQATECGVRNHLQSYFREINEVALLSAAEEQCLAEAIAGGDTDARRRMIQANLRLVVKIARGYLGRGMVLDDLIGEGNLGLIRAAEEYDPRYGTRFSTYASYWIKQAIRHALINTTMTIRLPAHMYGLLTKWRRAERMLCREFGRAASFDEVAAQLGLTEAQKSLVAKARRASHLKLESGLSDEEGSWSPDESTDGSPEPDVAFELNDERAEILRRLDRLDERERQVLLLRFGLTGEFPLTLKEIGHRLGVTREWVRKIELRAVNKLQDTVPGGSPAPAPARRPGRPKGSSRAAVARGEEPEPLPARWHSQAAALSSKAHHPGPNHARKRDLAPVPAVATLS
ncbi:MAG: RNA polymerase sigma factor RpoD/SigA [Planctomycetaceae bacterium]|nr:RNA polymerase sigma factor RpoD/SigA [Planctomycetaceae bacterium]